MNRVLAILSATPRSVANPDFLCGIVYSNREVCNHGRLLFQVVSQPLVFRGEVERFYSHPFELMSEFWNDRCEPSWPDDELRTKIRNAYAYCRDKKPGEDSPRADFEPIEVSDTGTKVPVWVQELNERHFAVRNGGKFAIGTEEFDLALRRRVLRLSSRGDFENFYCNVMVEVPNGAETKVVPKGTAWIKHRARRTYEGLVFDPTNQAQGVYNLWRGWDVEPRQGEWPLFLELISDVLCDGDEAGTKYVLDWIAAMVQRPEEPAEVALCFRGNKGTGKSTFGRALVRLAGQHGLQISSTEHLVGRFNDHLRDVICLFADEAFYAGNSRHEAVLKGIVTEPILAYEAKGQPIAIGRNLLHIIMASNNDWMVPASADERRFAVFDVSDKRQQDRAFFAAINREIQAGGLEAMLYDMLKRDIGGWHPRDSVPQTVGLVAQKLESMEPLACWWHNLLEVGELPLGVASGDATWASGPVEVRASNDDGARVAIGKDALLRSFRDTATRLRKPSQMTKAKMAQFLRVVGVDVEAKDKRANRVWRIPQLEEARAKFEKWIGGSLNWEE